MKRIGLALGGGGARGLCHIAFLKALDEMGYKPSIIAGTSMGAIIGAFYAAGISGREMEQILDKIGILEIRKMVDINILDNSSILKGKGVEEFFQRHIPIRTFEDLQIPLKIVAADFWRSKQVILSSGPLVPAIRASMSLPGIFEPIKMNDLVLIDGGAVNPVPYDIIRRDCDILIAIDVSGIRAPKKGDPIPSMFDGVMATFDIMMNSMIANQMKKIRPDIYIKPPLQNVRILDFHHMDTIMDCVKEDVVWFRAKLQRKIKGRLSWIPKRGQRYDS